MTQEDRDRLECLLDDAQRAVDEARKILYANRITDAGWDSIADAGELLASVSRQYGFSVRV